MSSSPEPVEDSADSIDLDDDMGVDVFGDAERITRTLDVSKKRKRGKDKVKKIKGKNLDLYIRNILRNSFARKIKCKRLDACIVVEN